MRPSIGVNSYIIINLVQHMNMQSTNDKEVVINALFNTSRDIQYAYENGDKQDVSEELIDVLKRKVPEEELKYIVSYLNDRIYE